MDVATNLLVPDVPQFPWCLPFFRVFRLFRGPKNPSNSNQPAACVVFGFSEVESPLVMIENGGYISTHRWDTKDPP